MVILLKQKLGKKFNNFHIKIIDLLSIDDNRFEFESKDDV